MNRSLFTELYHKVFRSGNPISLYIGINALVFIVMGLFTLFAFLFKGLPNISDLMTSYLSLPAYLPQLPYRLWTVVTYMFIHQGFFHVLFNMLWLYWMGQIFLNFLNNRQFHFVYLAGGLAGAAFFIAIYNLFPVFHPSLPGALLVGASACVMAIIVATATLVPDYGIFLFIFGEVKLKYLALVYIILDILGIAGSNAGGSLAHLGGALLGFIFIKQLRKGNDWSKLFTKKSKLKVVKNSSAPKRSTSATYDQEEIDSILDKISKSGYDTLSKEEKETLFRASKK